MYQMEYLTNAEVLDVVNPSGDYKAHYIYDTFKWTHCEKQGYAFSQTVTSSSDSS